MRTKLKAIGAFALLTSLAITSGMGATGTNKLTRANQVLGGDSLGTAAETTVVRRVPEGTLVGFAVAVAIESTTVQTQLSTDGTTWFNYGAPDTMVAESDTVATANLARFHGLRYRVIVDNIDVSATANAYFHIWEWFTE
jgi:hypothetical protein